MNFLKTRFETTASVIAQDGKKLRINESEQVIGYHADSHTLTVPKKFFHSEQLVGELLSVLYLDSTRRRFRDKRADAENWLTLLYEQHKAKNIFQNARAIAAPVLDPKYATILGTCFRYQKDVDAGLQKHIPAEILTEMITAEMAVGSIYEDLDTRDLSHISKDPAIQTQVRDFCKEWAPQLEQNSAPDYVANMFKPKLIDLIKKIWGVYDAKDDEQSKTHSELSQELDRLLKELFKTQKLVEKENKNFVELDTLRQILNQTPQDFRQLKQDTQDKLEQLNAKDISQFSKRELTTHEREKAKLEKMLEKLQRAEKPTPEQKAQEDEMRKQLAQAAAENFLNYCAVNDLNAKIQQNIQDNSAQGTDAQLNAECQPANASGFSKVSLEQYAARLQEVDFDAIPEPPDESLKTLIQKKFLDRDYEHRADESGRLNEKYIPHIISGTVDDDTDIYKAIHRRDKKTVVNLMIDVSGSMHGGQMGSAEEALLYDAQQKKIKISDTTPWRKDLDHTRLRLVVEVLKEFLAPLAEIAKTHENLVIHCVAFSTVATEIQVDRLLKKVANIRETASLGLDLFNGCGYAPENAIPGLGGGTSLFDTVDLTTNDLMTKYAEDDIYNVVLTDAEVDENELTRIERFLENNKVKQLFFAVGQTHVSKTLDNLTNNGIINHRSEVKEKLAAIIEALPNH